MKIKLYIFAMAAVLLGIASCDPIEDKTLREEFNNAGTPITKAELQNAISITQPFPNVDGVIEGDQYVVVKSSRPDIPVVWHYETNIGEKTLLTDHDTIVYEANGDFNIWAVAVSANEIVQTDPVLLSITNAFDPWEIIFSGAKDLADRTAKKTWEFWSSTEDDKGAVYFNGMFSNWIHYPIIADQIVEKWIYDKEQSGTGYTQEEFDKATDEAKSTAARNLRNIHNGLNNWGGITSLSAAGNYTMTFEYAGSKLTCYNPDGSVLSSGNYGLIHESPDKAYCYSNNHPGGYAVGTLITTNDLIGSSSRWQVGGNPWWIIYMDEDYLVIAYPASEWETGDFWVHDCWYAFYKAKK